MLEFHSLREKVTTVKIATPLLKGESIFPRRFDLPPAEMEGGARYEYIGSVIILLLKRI